MDGVSFVRFVSFAIDLRRSSLITLRIAKSMVY
jgi:hypothetical protein